MSSFIWLESGSSDSGLVIDATTSAKGIIQLTNDLNGTAASPQVIKINGTSIQSSPSANQILVASGSTSSAWSLLADANVAVGAAIAGSKLAYTDNVSPSLGATTMQLAIDAIKLQAVATSIQRLTQTISTATLQGAGAVLFSTFNIGSVLPSNARVLGAEINVTQILAGVGLSVAVATVQGSSDVAGSLIAGSTLLSTGLSGGTGLNQYLSRGGQQLTVTITLTGALLSALTSGALTVNIFYAVVT